MQKKSAVSDVFLKNFPVAAVWSLLISGWSGLANQAIWRVRRRQRLPMLSREGVNVDRKERARETDGESSLGCSGATGGAELRRGDIGRASRSQEWLLGKKATAER